MDVRFGVVGTSWITSSFIAAARTVPGVRGGLGRQRPAWTYSRWHALRPDRAELGFATDPGSAAAISSAARG